MAGPSRFGDLTHWDKTQQPAGSPDGGWYPPGQDWYIGTYDNGYWDRVLQSARDHYGDPNIHYNTDSPREDRYLTFGDGTRLPADQTVVYHDAASKRNWIQNDNGTVTPADANFKPAGPEVNPVGYRLMPDGKYAAPRCERRSDRTAGGVAAESEAWLAQRTKQRPDTSERQRRLLRDRSDNGDSQVL